MKEENSNNTKIIVFANYDYLPVLENWLAAIKKIELQNYLIVSLDEHIHQFLVGKEINSLLRPCDLGLGKLWVHRVEVILKLLEDGYNIVHSDADAIWIKDPMAKYIYNQPYDMIFSQGTYWPKEVHDKWNFVLCCGFFYLRSNEKVLSFVREWMLDVQKIKDDQVSCNKLLMKKEVKWEKPKNIYKLAFNDKEFECSDTIRQGEFYNMQIALLPHSKFQRVVDKNQDVYVKHIISEKNSSNIIDVLKENNCLFLDNSLKKDVIK